MKVLGLDKVEGFLADCTDRHRCDLLIAFVYELQHRNWLNTNAFENDYPQSELTELPKARFRLANNTLLVEAVIHFESEVVLLTKCFEKRHRHSDSGDQTEWEAA